MRVCASERVPLALCYSTRFLSTVLELIATLSLEAQLCNKISIFKELRLFLSRVFEFSVAAFAAFGARLC